MASLYLHIPFCEHKCIYCDFYSIESLDAVESLLCSLRKEIAMYSSYRGEDTFATVYFGGGTPSLLKPRVVGDLLELLQTTFNFDDDAEITLEANPGTVDRKKLKGYRDVGVNRLSFGVQSFSDDELRFLTRIHSSAQARESVLMAKEVGFENVSLDLIFALPNQTFQMWEKNLRRAVDLEPQHISAYSLIVEKNTPLARMVGEKRVSPLPLEIEAEMYEFTMAFLQAAGFEHYEVSNYAKPGYRSKHNSNYWNHTNYLGFGPSAHSFWSFNPGATGKRWWNIASLRAYLERLADGRLAVAGEEILDRERLISEAVMLGLRSDGVNFDRLRSDYGFDLLETAGYTIEALVANELAVTDKAMLRLTDRGYLLCDEITEVILSHTLTAEKKAEVVV